MGKALVSGRPCKERNCHSEIYLDDDGKWYCIEHNHPQGEYGSK